MNPILKLMVLLLPVISLPALAQDKPADKILSFPQKFIGKIHDKASRLEAKLDRQTEKYLMRLARREQRLKKQLSTIDSGAAQQLYGNSEQAYDGLMNQPADHERPRGQYIPLVDSIKTSLHFLQQHSGQFPQINGQQISGSLQQVNQLQSKLQYSEQVKAFIQQRKELMKQTLSKYSGLPKSLNKNLAKFNKEYYYYTQQLQEYRELLNNPDKMVQKGLDVLRRTDAFQSFMQKHSELAALFPMPANYGTPQALAGLQTRSQVQQLIQGQIAGAGPNAMQQVQQNLQMAQAEISRLKDKINELGGGNSDMEIPEFKPNTNRTKTFLQRLEWGTNIQSAKSNNFFPTTTDIGLSMGYKLNDKNSLGIGASYKIGWGKDIRHITVTSEGIGLRSFVDIKLKGSFYASGGFEYNYQQPFNPLSITNELDKWQQSGLAGLSKIISLKSKLFKKTKVQLLWDFLSYQQVPRTQAVKFRLGYNF